MKPYNVVYFFCDEIRLDALNCYGNAFAKMKTKHIDEIAEHGTLFDNCFCNSPVCVPSRMSLLTGLYPEDTGVYHNEAAIPGYTLDGEYDSIPKVLARHGYEVASFGKTHLPDKFQPFPHNDERGSSMGFASHKGITNIITPKKEFKSKIGGRWPIDEPYPCDDVTKNALTWMKKQEAPYFARISYLQPHTPVVVKQPFDQLYKDEKFPMSFSYEEKVSGFEKSFAQLFGLDSLSKQEIHDMYVYYYGMVAWIDEQIGIITQYLKDSGAWNHTVLIFGGDHGALRGENGCLAKQIFAPCSQRVPLLIACPDKVEKGIVDHRLCSNIDMGKTLFSLLNIDCPTQFRGYDVFQPEKETYVFASIGYGETCSRAFPFKLYGTWRENHGWPRRACIRTNQYRLDMNVRIDGMLVDKEEEDIFFCDYQKDSMELHNCAHEINYQAIVQELKDALLEHIKNAKEVDRGTLMKVNKMIEQHTH